MAAVAATALSAAAYAIVLLLPVQNWVLGAADAYAHFATLPVGLWTLAALIELAGRSLPTATLAPPCAAGLIRTANPSGNPRVRRSCLRSRRRPRDQRSPVTTRFLWESDRLCDPLG